MKLVEAAVTEIRTRAQIQRTGLTGQSGGGTIAAYVLTQQPELSCVALTSAELSMQAILRTSAASHYDTVHFGELYDPLEHVSAVRGDANRQIFVVWSEGDQFSPPENQKEYAEALCALGHRVQVIEGEATGATRHTLDKTGRFVTAWCLKGMDADEIAFRVRSGEVKG